MVPLLALAVASILAGKYLRTLAVVVLIAQAAVEEPALGTIEVLVNQVCLLLLHVLPSQFEHLALGVRTAGAHNLDVGILGADGLHERSETFII